MSHVSASSLALFAAALCLPLAASLTSRPAEAGTVTNAANGCWANDGTFAWSCSGQVSGMSCVQILETADLHTWNDNYFCSKNAIGMRWSSAGPIAGMRCTQILETADPDTWNDNYLCVPNEAAYTLLWSSAGPIADRKCVQWLEASDPHTWNDNYLCWTPRGGNAAGVTGTPSRPFAIDRVFVNTGPTCPSDARFVSTTEATNNRDALCGKLGQWYIVNLGGGAAMDGSGYGCKIRSNQEGGGGHSLCVR